MFCSTCGNKFSAEHNYCPEDGNQLTKLKETWHPEALAHSHCRTCGQAQDHLVQYCSSCGTSVMSLKFNHSKTAGAQRQSSVSPQSISKNNNTFVSSWQKNSLIGAQIAVMSFAAVFILAALFRNLIVNLSNEFQDMVADLPLRVGDAFLFLHSVPLNIHIPGMGVQSFQIGLYPFLLLSGLIFALTAFLYGKRAEETSLFESFKTALISGGVYGAALGITAFITSRSLSFDAFFETIQISYSYPFFQTVFTGFFTMTLFTAAGFLLAKGLHQSREELGSLIPYGGSLLTGAKAFTAGLAVITAVYTIYVYNTEISTELAFEAGSMASLIFSMQVAAFIVPLLHLQSLQFQIPEVPVEVAHQSLWLFSSSTNPLFAEANIGGISPFIMFGILIPLGLFIWMGMKIKERYGSDFLKPVLMAAGAYTVLTLLLGNFIKLSMAFDPLTLVIGPGLFLSAVTTFIFCSAVTYLTAWLRS